jgi:3-deoxy-7-phosphoheptulonate synthase
MSEYIEGLKAAGKLRDVFDKSGGFKVGNASFGDSNVTLISGPCSVESRESFISQALALESMGTHILRGGAFKPCTYPVREALPSGWKEGIGFEGLEIMKYASEKTGLPVVTEIMDHQTIERALPYIDMVQVGTRNAQNYTLLDELGRAGIPVLLKRGTWMTVDEILGAVERIYSHGNFQVAVCLRGVVGAPSYRHVWPSVRWAPDLMMIAALKELCPRLPVVYDPSHACGKRDFVGPMAIAAIAAGADGLIIESHPDPANSISDPDQAVTLETLGKILEKARAAYEIRWKYR